MSSELALSYRRAGHRLLRQSIVPMRTLDSILSEANVKEPLSLLSLDVEGFELTALQTIDLERWRPVLVCLEVQTADGSNQADAVEYLRRNGYEVVRNLGLNVIFKRTASHSLST